MYPVANRTGELTPGLSLPGLTDLLEAVYPKLELLSPWPSLCARELIGQNVRTDVIFLERAFRNCNIDYPFDYHVIDLATLFYSWSLVSGEEPAALSLRQAAQTAGLLDGVVEHRAMADTRLTLDTFRHFIGALAPKPPN